MRNTFLTLAISVATFAFTSSAFAALSIDGWDDSIPVSQQDTANQIETKVADLTFADEGQYLGGQAWDYKLVDYYTNESNDGAITYNVRIQYHASMSLDWGKTEVTRLCTTLVKIDHDHHVDVGAIECPDVNGLE